MASQRMFVMFFIWFDFLAYGSFGMKEIKDFLFKRGTLSDIFLRKLSYNLSGGRRQIT